MTDRDAAAPSAKRQCMEKGDDAALDPGTESLADSREEVKLCEGESIIPVRQYLLV